jgi:hypothetical protein
LALFFNTGCGVRTELPSRYDVTDRLQWDALNAVFEDNGVVLQSPNGTSPAMIRQRTKRLRQNSVYRLSMRVQAERAPTATVHADLYLGDHYDSPEHELVIPEHAIMPVTHRFERLLNSGTFSELPYLRVFTFSTVPILIQEITVVEVS